MNFWVDLSTVQWAYAHSNQYDTSSPTDHYTAGLERKFRFKPVLGKGGNMTRYKIGTRYPTGMDIDKEILLDFEDDQAHVWFILTWSGH